VDLTYNQHIVAKNGTPERSPGVCAFALHGVPPDDMLSGQLRMSAFRARPVFRSDPPSVRDPVMSKPDGPHLSYHDETPRSQSSWASGLRMNGSGQLSHGCEMYIFFMGHIAGRQVSVVVDLQTARLRSAWSDKAESTKL
jgi:hypothetical protein